VRPKGLRGPGYSDSALVVQAAIAGQGIALSRLSLVREDLADGRLVRPCGPVLRTGFAYYALTIPAAARDRRVQAFVAWLQEQAARQNADPVLAEAVDPVAPPSGTPHEGADGAPLAIEPRTG
jgi:LysR family glycine cleavage system transcriptional activator